MWRTVKLGDVLELQNGFAFKSKEYTADGFFVMRITNVQQGYISAHNPKYIQIDSSSKLTKFILEEGDILVSLTGDVGRVGVIREEHLPAALNQRVARVQSLDGCLDRQFLFHYLNSTIFRNQVEALGKGAAQANVSTKDILEITLEIPPFAEQQRIVAKLDAVFAEIDRSIENCDAEVKQSTQLFDALVFERFTKATDEEPVALKELTKELLTGPFGSALHKSDYVEDGIAVINPQNLINNEIIPSEGKFINEQKFEELKRYELKENDIVIARRGEMGRCALVPASTHKMICGTGCMILRTNDDCSAVFVAELIRSKYVRNALEQGAIGATMLNLNQGILLSVTVQAKTMSQQQENTAYIADVRDITNRYEGLKLEKMKQLNSLKSAILSQELQPSQSEAA